jgi:hypothetical protein
MITGRNYLGGFVGWNVGNTISNSYVETINLDITGETFLGGFVGNNNDSSITNSFVNAINLNITGAYELGGIVGHAAQSNITNSFVNANNLNITGETQLGGFVGYASQSNITNSYVNANNLNITGSSYLGGFIGENTGGSIIANSYVSASGLVVSGIDRIGGIVGRNALNSEINNMFLATSTLQVVGNTNSDLFFGQSNGSFSNSFFNSGLNGEAWISVSGDSIATTLTASEISSINASTLLTTINGSDAFRLADETPNGEFFPVLVQSGVITLASQSQTLIYWLIPEEPQPENINQTPPPSTSQVTPITSKPLDTELIILAVNQTIEVGSTFILPYEAYTLFGYIKTDYTSDVVIEGSFDLDVVGEYSIRLSVTAEGMTTQKSVTISVVDVTRPVITGPISIRLFVGDEYESNLVATDNVDSSPTLLALSSLDSSTAGITDVIWQASDASGNVTIFTQTVEVVVPEVQVITVSINNQTFVFSVSEANYNLSQLRVEYVVSSTEPNASTKWQVFTGTPSANPGERVFVRLSDGINTSDVRQTIAVPEIVRITEPVVLPDIETSSSNTFLVGLGSVAGLSAAATGWWFLIGKKRRQNEEEN